ncbi:hypothetical protein N7474_001474 [Penicillium riverlandense]|uniref:uncharacterized protein n=1 Tax=Penicillium riverlandense TaxID=1903569 RepID=UPI002548A93A|nr:uncharacterized protein N7474_001474 [Penicillium riverlandense]KAJ5833163.1 hypothetical protein N7474_001474 [Penicillium riverlandense]
MAGLGVGHHLTDVVRELLLFMDEVPVRVHTAEDGPRRDGFRLEGMTNRDRLQRPPGATPPLGPPKHRPHSPSFGAPRDHSESFNQGRSLSPSRRPSPAHALAAESEVTSRRSSPAGYLEKAGLSLCGQSGSPIRPSSPSQRASRSQARSPYSQDPVYQTAPSSSDRVTENPEFLQSNYDATFPTASRGHDPDGRGMLRMTDHRPSDQSQMGGIRTSSNIPTQPRSHSGSPLPPSGPSQGSNTAASSQSRGSQNMSLLSAPTRPRRGPGSRESSWMGAPLRRVPVPAPSHGAPAGSRGSFTSPTPAGGSYRYPGSRQNSIPSPGQPPASRFTNHLAGLCSVTPGGRTLPSLLDPVTEKRLSQLEADQVKLLEQIAETQRAKRTGLRDWDKLDRESSISALRSELAEGHLQRMADESIGGSILF